MLKGTYDHKHVANKSTEEYAGLNCKLYPLVAGEFPQRPIRGLTRFSNLLHHWLPPYRGIIQLPDGIRMLANSEQSAERWLMFSGNYQPALTYVLKQHTRQNGYCLDVGANLGFYTLLFAKWTGSAGHVVAFEANPAMLERTQYNVSLNQFPHVDTVNAAVHNEAGQIEFYIAKDPGKSSIQPIKDATEKIVAPAITIDSYVQQKNFPRLDALKIDVEGNDCNVLIGAREALARFRPFIAFEYRTRHSQRSHRRHLRC